MQYLIDRSLCILWCCLLAKQDWATLFGNVTNAVIAMNCIAYSTNWQWLMAIIEYELYRLHVYIKIYTITTCINYCFCRDYRFYRLISHLNVTSAYISILKLCCGCCGSKLLSRRLQCWPKTQDIWLQAIITRCPMLTNNFDCQTENWMLSNLIDYVMISTLQQCPLIKHDHIPS